MSLEAVREEINRVDNEIIRLIAQRQRLAEQVAAVKIASGIPVHDEGRTNAVLRTVSKKAAEQEIDPVSVQKIFEILIAMSEERQHEYAGKGYRG